MMKENSGLVGWGNPQCISWVSEEIGEISLYGHNEHYHTYDVARVVSYPIEEVKTKKMGVGKFTALFFSGNINLCKSVGDDIEIYNLRNKTKNKIALVRILKIF